MKHFFIQKNSFLLLFGILVVGGASLVYLFMAGNGSVLSPAAPTLTPQVAFTPLAALTQAPPPKKCSSTHRPFQTGIAFPQWGPAAYSESDGQWLTELPEMQSQTAACWVEMPILFYQSSLSATTVTTGQSTASLSSFNYGIHLAHALGLQVFVTPLLQVDGPQPWSGAIKFATYDQEQQWFASYWQAIKPYAVAAAQAGVEQFALGTEYEWLQEYAPASLWNALIADIRSIFPGTLTYDMNWTSLQVQPPSWMHNPDLKMIGVSAYLPVIGTPERIDPQLIPDLWKKTVKAALDRFAARLGEPIFISEIGYRNSSDALYQSWEAMSSAPRDPAEQAAACDAALANIVSDPKILGSFFWGWDDVDAFNLSGLQAARVIQQYYASLQS